MVNPHIGVPLEEYLKDNIGLIYHVIRKYQNFNQDDLFQEAAIEFVKCYKKFDGRGKFSSYVIPSMRGSVFKYIEKFGSVLRKPQGVQEVQEIARKNGLGEGDVDELAELTGREKKYIEYAMKNYEDGAVLWIDSEIKNADGIDYHGLVSGYDDYRMIYANEFLETLNDRQREIMSLLLKGHRQVDVAKKFNVTKQAIDQTKRRVLKMSKEFFKEDEDEVS